MQPVVGIQQSMPGVVDQQKVRCSDTRLVHGVQHAHCRPVARELRLPERHDPVRRQAPHALLTQQVGQAAQIGVDRRERMQRRISRESRRADEHRVRRARISDLVHPHLAGFRLVREFLCGLGRNNVLFGQRLGYPPHRLGGRVRDLDRHAVALEFQLCARSMRLPPGRV